MLTKIINFLKYNNATVLIVVLVFVAGTGVFAATDQGQEILGKKETKVEGVDNTLLLETDLATFSMDFKIEKIEEDNDNYFVTYTYLDLDKVNNAWQYQVQEKVRKISKKSGVELSAYIAQEMKQAYEDRIKELRFEQEKANLVGQESRTEVTAYTGLIGKTLDVASAVFPGFTPETRTELPAPDRENLLNLRSHETGDSSTTPSSSDNLAQVYQNYIADNDPDHDNIFGDTDNCPNVYNPDQLDSNQNGIGDACETASTTTPGEITATQTIDAAATDQASGTPATTSDVPTEPQSVQILDIASTTP